MGSRRWSGLGLKVEELTEMKWVLRELAMDDGLFESKADQFSGGPEEAVASLMYSRYEKCDFLHST